MDQKVGGSTPSERAERELIRRTRLDRALDNALHGKPRNRYNFFGLERCDADCVAGRRERPMPTPIAWPARGGRAIGYDLAFWKQAGDEDLEPSTVYRSLIDHRTVEGLATLPIESILTELLVVLPGSVRESNGAGWEWIDWVSEDDQSSIQIWWSDLHVYADCRNAEYEVVNRIIDVLADFGCPLYDPQVDKRFESSP
jgi:hypothetical protein